MLRGLFAKIRRPAAGGRLPGGGGRRRLTPAQVKEIRRRHKGGESQSALAREYGISQPSIYAILNRQSYKDIP